MTFEAAVAFVLDHEGGLSIDSADHGGVTNWGISSRAYPGLDVRNLSRQDAIDIYRRDYWDVMCCGKMPPDVAMVLLDTGVNCGTYRAGVLLQLAINSALKSSGFEIFVDGFIGPKTIQAANMRQGEGVACEMLLKRLAFYRGLIKRDRSQGKFVGGWLARVIDLYQKVRK